MRRARCRVRIFSARASFIPGLAPHIEYRFRSEIFGWLPGHATTGTDIRFKSRFETSGEFHRNIPPPTPRSEATVCTMTGGNIPEPAATAIVALLIVLLSVRTIGNRGEQCRGGES